jgi:ArsR family transcriptional regulator
LRISVALPASFSFGTNQESILHDNRLLRSEDAISQASTSIPVFARAPSTRRCHGASALEGSLILRSTESTGQDNRLSFDYTGNIEAISGLIMENKDAVVALAALAQESRLATFRLLVQAGPGGLAASKIAEALGIPPSSLSFHLKELAHANLIVARQEGRFVIYAAQFDTMNTLLGFLAENCCGGKPCSSTGPLACEPGTSACGS